MSDTKPIRIMIVDDHAVVRSGLATFLTIYDDLELVAEAGTALVMVTHSPHLAGRLEHCLHLTGGRVA